MAKNPKSNARTDFFAGTSTVPVQTTQRNTQQITQQDTQLVYSFTQEELRKKRIQIVVKPSTNDRIDALVKKGVVKSKNDLVNVLLENYLDKVEQQEAKNQQNGTYIDPGQMTIDDVE